METPQKSKANHTDPVDKKEEVKKSKDKHIDQDFEGYPHPPAKENVIHPKTEEELRSAGSGDEEEFTHVKPEEKDDNENEEIFHNGSGGAFEATEEVDDEKDELEKKRGDKFY